MTEAVEECDRSEGEPPGASGGAAARPPRPFYRKKRFWFLAAFLLPPLWVAFHAGSALLRAPDLAALAVENPSETSLMRARDRAARKRGETSRRLHSWIRYERISPHLRKAVLLAEDASFYQHAGLDFHEIRESIRKDLKARRFARGGSTITQQLAKNLWLGEQKTIGRKIEEVVLAIRLERALSKKRILELYLNLIEWGDGVYGAEAAARRWFGKGASDLTVRESAILAGMIPNPRRWNPDRVGKGITWRTRTVLRRLRASGYITPAMYEEIVSGGPPEISAPAETARVDSLLPPPVEGEPGPAPGGAGAPAGADSAPAPAGADTAGAPASPSDTSPAG